MKTWPAKRLAETIRARFDYSDELADGVTVTSATVTASLRSGADANPSAILQGAAVVSGADALQLLTGGVDGAQYKITCLAQTSDGQTLAREAVLPVRA